MARRQRTVSVGGRRRQREDTMRRSTVLPALLVLFTTVDTDLVVAQAPPPATQARLLDSEAFGKELGSRYPAHYERAGVGGTVRLKAFVDTAGKADSVRVVSSSGVAELDGVARRAVRSC